MFRGAIKEDLKLIASELNIEVLEKSSVFDLNNAIKNSEQYKTDPISVTDLANNIIENRKTEDLRQIELEKIKLERSKAELELAQLRAQAKSGIVESEPKSESCDSLESLIKSVRTLTLKVPSKPEAWGYFFSSLERAFSTKNVPENLKAEILLNLLGERASNIIIYVKDEELSDYEKIKNIVLKEFEPTPQACLQNFKNAQRLNESHVQFASRLTTSFEYYLKLRGVSDFETLKQLIVSDKLFETLDKETAAHIAVRQADKWFPIQQMAIEADLFFTSRGKSLSEGDNSSQKYRSNSTTKNVSKVFLSDVKSSKCVLCNENHPLFKCPSYLKLSVNERIDVVKTNKRCFNCLNLHPVNSCRSKYSCGKCKRRHHVTLHFSQEQRKGERVEKVEGEISSPLSVTAPVFRPSLNSGESSQNVQDNFAGTSHVFNASSKTVLLSTFVCFLFDERGTSHSIRGLLDVGANSNFMSKRCADRLQLKREKININVSGLNGSSLNVNSRVNTSITNESRNFKLDLDFLVVPCITDWTPSKPINFDFSLLNNIKLADESFNVPGPIDLLLGAENFYELLRPGQIYPPNTKLILQNTVFGYVVSGSIPCVNDNRVICGLINDSVDLDKTLRSFWEIESIEVDRPKNKETVICEENFEKTYSRNKEGKFIVKMPLKEFPSCLGKSRETALRQLNSLWQKLAKDPVYLSLYRGFLNEYEELGHMREVTEDEEPSVVYYMPHHGIYRPQKQTTKLRVVFNASSLTNKGNSLNSIQYNGGVIQEDLYSIMLRFRKHIYAFTADIQRMYRMIEIHPSQRDLLRILWKNSIDSEVKTYELCTVTYGTTSAPFLAMRTLKQLSIDVETSYPAASTVLREDFYMDDVLSGKDTISGAKELQRQLTEALNSAQMKLHKWCANCPELLLSSEIDYVFSESEEMKALGVCWKPTKDSFSFNVDVPSSDCYTKRSVLSMIAKIFDPLGLLGPIITKAKVFMQSLWLLKIDWSDGLPQKEAQEWHLFLKSLPVINSILVPRCILVKEAISVELHGFSDASEVAYGAAIYAKSFNSSGDCLVTLITSKSRVAPVKRATIPRLELCAAVLLSKLMKKVLTALRMEITNIYLWTDSMIVLSWIHKESSTLKTFVANRIATIQELTLVHQWRHVPTDQNPADLISRGLDPDKLHQCKLWFEGPTFLRNSEYPNREILSKVISDEFSKEFKPSSDSNCFINDNSNFLDNFFKLTNNYSKIIRVLSYVYRFIENCRRKDDRSTGFLSTEELKQAELRLVGLVQGNEFSKEIKDLTCTGEVSRQSQVKSLCPFIDKAGILRVGGRLSNSNLCFDKKFPILLPSNHQLTRLIIHSYHIKHLHVGPQTLLFTVRQTFWPINGRASCRKIVHECVACFKAKPITCDQLMGDLPKERVSQNFPFVISGVDFCGPFTIKYKHQRKGTYQKIYVAIFVCFVTKAVHLELVTELSSQAFIATLRRFFSRRGKCSLLYSDNGTNFVGSNTELQRLFNMVKNPDENLSGYMSSENVKWKFLPPRAPNFGGLWEAGVRSFKYHLKRVVGDHKLTYENFLTVVNQIESILNSRPLTPLSSDVDDLSALTPGHFLIGRPFTSIVEPDLSNISENRMSLWQKTTKFVQQIWKKWHNDYLTTLHQRSKWCFDKQNIKVGDMVVIKEDNMAVCNWAIGRIVTVFPGKDGRVRVASIKTKKGVFKRPISKICILPIK